ncbi:MAG: hypothetical protein Roseis2KO_60230 [Roseivirga sp.]
MTARSRLSLVLLICLIQPVLYAQNQQIADSLYLLKNERGNLIDSLGFRLNLDLAFYESSPVLALSHSLEALDIARQLNRKVMEAEALELIGTNHRIIGNKTKGFDASFSALAIYDSLNLQTKRISLLLQLGTQYTADENYIDGIKYMRRSLDLSRALGRREGENYTLINIGETYRLMGQLDSALYYNELVLSSEAAKTDEVIRAYTEGNTGMVLNAQNQLSRAEPLLQSAITSLTALGDPYSVSVYQADLGELKIRQGQRSEGLRQIKKALDIARAENLKEQIRDFSQILSGYYSAMHDYQQAYDYQVQYAAYRDSLLNADNIRKIAETRYRYELDKKERALENLALTNELGQVKLQKANARTMLFVLLALSLLVLATLLYRGYKAKKKANTLLINKNEIIAEQSVQKELLHRELHHRVKNNLQLIGSIMSLQSSSTSEASVARAMKEGKSRVDALMLIHQNLYREEDITHVHLPDYLRRLCENIRASYRAELDNISHKSVDIELRTDDIIPLGLIINEAVSNALKHRRKKAIDIQISFNKTAAGYELLIADNGPGGFDLADTGKNAGFGTKLIKTLSKQLRSELSAQSNEQGTQIRLLLKQEIAAEKPTAAAS